MKKDKCTNKLKIFFESNDVSSAIADMSKMSKKEKEDFLISLPPEKSVAVVLASVFSLIGIKNSIKDLK